MMERGYALAILTFLTSSRETALERFACPLIDHIVITADGQIAQLQLKLER